MALLFKVDEKEEEIKKCAVLYCRVSAVLLAVLSGFGHNIESKTLYLKKIGMI